MEAILCKLSVYQCCTSMYGFLHINLTHIKSKSILQKVYHWLTLNLLYECFFCINNFIGKGYWDVYNNISLIWLNFDLFYICTYTLFGVRVWRTQHKSWLLQSNVKANEPITSNPQCDFFLNIEIGKKL